MSNPLGEKVKSLRKKNKLTLEKLADEIKSTKSYIWELENKEVVRPSAEKVFKLASALGVTAEYLIDETNNIPAKLNDEDKVFFTKYQKLSNKDKDMLKKFIDSLVL